MVSMTLPMVGKLTKLSLDHFYISTRTILSNRTSQTSINNLCYQIKKFGTEQKKVDESSSSSPPPSIEQMTDNENKLKSEIELLNKELMSLKERNIELDNKYKRALADGENLRVRLTKQIEDAKLFGIQGFCKDLLDVADILGKATESVPKDQLTERNPHLKTLYEGLRMTESQLHKVFKKHGLVSVNPLDEKFDPNQHEALFQQEVQGKKPGTVVVVSKVGYKLHERIVRPALVGVAKG
ncbi:grpE protein homolog, mitochondrial [Microplitis demolitor]|uniref:grpE protein homolog, mitochondrial n=1 Tax=Microplitis demolitor TaxID=69319 RepID=UPI0004CDAAD1|nr:grpE protein homolog, mitochondrial [Microplitis demolitor]